jgi:type II secretory pathway pseudopilin PulG
MFMKRLSQRGDTIVEVLIAMLVVSTVLGGAFVTSNQSQLEVRNSQEHAEALKLIESQLEAVRADATSSSPTVFTASTPFCMYNNSAVSATTQPTAADCEQDASGTPTTAQPQYALSIARVSSNGGFLFTINATWYQVNGGGKANETMVYRLYQ